MTVQKKAQEKPKIKKEADHPNIHKHVKRVTGRCKYFSTLNGHINKTLTSVTPMLNMRQFCLDAKNAAGTNIRLHLSGLV